MDLRKLAEDFVNGPDNGSAHVLEALLEKVAAGEEPDEEHPGATPGHSPTCWCNGTGWRAELGVPCRLPQIEGA